MATEPYNIIVGPFEVWTAPTGTTFPALTTDPASPWEKLGANQSQEYNDDGVSVMHEQTVDLHRFLGGTGPRKATRSEENLRIELTVHDMSLEQYAKAVGSDVEDVTGPPAAKAITLYRGFDVLQFALLVRGASPYDDSVMQYEVPVVAVDGEPEVVYNKTEPAGLLFSFVALEDPTATSIQERYGRLLASATAP